MPISGRAIDIRPEILYLEHQVSVQVLANQRHTTMTTSPTIIGSLSLIIVIILGLVIENEVLVVGAKADTARA